MEQNILIVDDDRNVCQIVSKALITEGYEVDIANDGEMCINKLKKKSYDIVLLDLRLPVFTGEELFKIIKTGYPYTDVIIITAYATIESAIDTLKKGAYDYILKPINIDNLTIVVRRCLEKRRLFNELSDEKRCIRKWLNFLII